MLALFPNPPSLSTRVQGPSLNPFPSSGTFLTKGMVSFSIAFRPWFFPYTVSSDPIYIPQNERSLLGLALLTWLCSEYNPASTLWQRFHVFSFSFLTSNIPVCMYTTVLFIRHLLLYTTAMWFGQLSLHCKEQKSTDVFLLLVEFLEHLRSVAQKQNCWVLWMLNFELEKCLYCFPKKKIYF